MNEQFEIDVFPHSFGNVTYADKYGGKIITINISPDVVEMFNWMKSYRLAIEIEERIRDENLFVKEKFQEYQAALLLAKD